MDSSLIERKIEESVVERPEGIIISELISEIRKCWPQIDRKTIKEAIRNLLDEGSLMYVNRLGQTMISTNINRPVRVSDRIWITPPNTNAHAIPNDCIFIRISPGIAFGNGIHPTTKMCLKAVDAIFKPNDKKISMVLDIGTGTGILAIAAYLLGAEACIGTDIDVCARTEAKANVAYNDISEKKIEILNTDIDPFSMKFDLVTANLRYPTLISLSPIITSAINPNGFAILSGMRPEEKKAVFKHYEEKFQLLQEFNEFGWSAFLLKKLPDLQA